MTRLLYVVIGLLVSTLPVAAQTGFSRSSVTAGNFNILGSTAPAQTVNGQLVVRSTTGTSGHLLFNVRNQSGSSIMNVSQDGAIAVSGALGGSASTETASIVYFGTAAPLGGVAYNLTLASNTYVKAQLQVDGDLSVGMSTTIYTVGGRVGVGTASPLTTLDINGATTIRGNITSTSSGTFATGAEVKNNRVLAFRLVDDTNNAGEIFSNPDNDLIFRTNSGVLRFKLTGSAANSAFYVPVTISGSSITISNQASPAIALWTSNVNANSRNWALYSEQAVNGDIGLFRSNAVGGNPTSDLVRSFYVTAGGGISLHNGPLTVTGSSTTLDGAVTITGTNKLGIGTVSPCSTCTLHVQGNTSLGYIEVSSMSVTQGMTLSNSTWTQRGTTNADFQARITNANAGTSAKTDLYVSNDDSTAGSLEIGTGGTGLTAIVGEARAQDAGWLVSGTNLSNGLSLAADATSSNMRFYTGGSLAANLRAQYDGSNGSLTILSTVTLNTNTVAQTAALLQVGGAQTALTGTNIQLVNNPAAANGGIATKNTGGIETAMFAESGAAGSIGTTSNHQLKIITNNTSRMALDTLGAITTMPRISSTTLTIDGSGGAFTVGDANNALLASFFGPQRLYSRTKTQIDTLAATTVGQIVFVSNIATSGDVCVSTGTAAAQWRRIGTAAGCGTNE